MNQQKLKQFILLVIDSILLFISLHITLVLRYANEVSSEIKIQHIQVFIPVFVLFILSTYINSLYDFKKIINKKKLLEQSIKSVSSSFIIAMVIFYLLPNSQVTPKTNLLIFALFFWVFFLIWRISFMSLNKKYLTASNIAIIGYNQIIRKIIKEIQANPQLGYKVKFMVNERNNVTMDIADMYNIDLIENTNELEEAIRNHKIDSLILEKDISKTRDLQKVLYDLLPTGINYYNLVNFYEEISGQIPLEILSKAWLLENLHLAEKKNYEKLKYVTDIALSSIFIITSLPILIITAILVLFSSKGPVIFTQTRSGQNGKTFKLYKFRSMRINDNNLEPTQENDPRITGIGKFIRKSRLDELPQLVNVLKGDMSFVGPRPERPEIIEELSKEIPFYSVRSLVKPGISGWDQISGEYHSPSKEDTYKKLQYDLYYIKNRSIYLDISIILKTIETALSQEGR